MRFPHRVHKSASDDESAASQQRPEKKPEFKDFQIISKVIHLTKISNQMKQMENMRKPESELEQCLLNFCVLYKNHVLTDSKMIQIAINMNAIENSDDATVVDCLD